MRNTDKFKVKINKMAAVNVYSVCELCKIQGFVFVFVNFANKIQVRTSYNEKTLHSRSDLFCIRKCFCHYACVLKKLTQVRPRFAFTLHII